MIKPRWAAGNPPNLNFMKILTALLLLIAGLAVQAAPTTFTAVIGDTSLTNSLVASKAPCKLFAVTGYNSGPDQFITVFQTNAVPADGVKGKLGPFPVGSGQFYSIDLSAYGADLDAVTICNSTTAETLTKGSADCSIQAVIGR